MNNPFEKAKENLRKYGWIQGDYGSRHRGFCLVGGLDQALRQLNNLGVKDIWTQEEATAVSLSWGQLSIVISNIIKEQYPERLEIGATLPRFNDNPTTTQEDVFAVLDKASMKWEEDNG